jgi:hypothetical protein
MKIESTLPPSNLKAGIEARRQALIAANGRRVRYRGGVYIIHTVVLSGNVLADAQAVGVKNAPMINLHDTNGIARDLKQLVVNRLFT